MSLVDRGRTVQFSISRLMELVLICSLLLALAPVMGIVASGGLSLAACGLLLRNGPLTILMLSVAVIGADVEWDPRFGEHGVSQQLIVISAGGALCAWYAWRAKKTGRGKMPNRSSMQLLLPAKVRPWSTDSDQ